jgi:hypothetical protein
MNEERLEKVERLLREERGVTLSPQFKQRAMAAVPGIAVFLLPSMGDVFAAFAWEFSDLTLSISVGETALSASLLTVIAAVAGGLCMTGAGAYAARNHLIGA